MTSPHTTRTSHPVRILNYKNTGEITIQPDENICSRFRQEQQHVREEFEDTKGVIRIRKSKKDRQHNGQGENDKRTNNDFQNITHKTKDRATWTLKPGVNSGAPEGYAVPAPLFAPVNWDHNHSPLVPGCSTAHLINATLSSFTYER